MMGDTILMDDTNDIFATPGDLVDAKSKELIDEFYDHLVEMGKLHPECDGSQDEIFQGWIIQKIAGLQLSIQYVSEQVNKIVLEMENKKKGAGDE